MKCTQFSSLASTVALATGLCFNLSDLHAQEAEPAATESDPAAAQSASEDQGSSPELIESFLRLQEQLHVTQMAVERSRLQAEADASRDSEALNARLIAIEKALDQTRSENSDALLEASQQIRDSNGQLLLVAGIFAFLGFLALALTGWFQWKTAVRLSAVSATAGFPALLAPQGYGTLGSGQTAARASTVGLMDALGRLEHRISDLEVGHRAPLRHNGSVDMEPLEQGSPVGGELGSLIAEGEELLAHEEAEKAIELFNAVLAKHPGHPEVLLRKGAALERLRRDQEAIDCYDEAIRADKNLTMAYLHKGGLYNRMEKFSEAMECYEQALKVQEGRTAAS